jgi:predicted permease
MKPLRRVWQRFFGTFSSGRREKELSAELEAHIEMQTEDNVRLGMSLEEARRAALLKFGGVESTKEHYRDQRGLPQLETLAQDVRFAVRALAKHPSFVVVAILSLGIGIGVNATVFTWFKAVYLNPLPGVREARKLITISAAYKGAGAGYSNSYADLLYFRAHSGLFTSLFGHEMQMLALSDGKYAEMTTGGIVSGNYFEVLGAPMALGRSFRSEEDEALDRNPVMVLGYGLWQRRFAGDPNIIGRRLELNRTPFTVIGVAAPGFIGVYGGIRQDYWVPLHMARVLDSEHGDRLAHGSWIQIMGRAKPGVTLAEIQSELDVLSAQIRRDYRKDDREYRAVAYPLHRAQRGYHSGIFQMVQILAVAVAIILLLACLNVANLLIARATDRAREISVRLSLGASRGRIIRQLFTESVVLAALSGAAGLLIAYWTRSVPTMLSGQGFELYLNLGIDWTVIGFLFAVSLGAAVVFGLLPAIETTRLNLVDALKEGAGSVTAGRRRHLWRSSLVVGQVALSMAALVSAALFAQHLLKMLHTDLGFKPHNVLTAETDLFAAGMNESRGHVFYRRAIDQLQALPQVASAAWTTFLPMSGSGGGNRRKMEVQGYSAPDGKPLAVVTDTITPGFLHTLAIPLVAGREFEWSDDKTAAQVVIVNQAFAGLYLKGREPLGAAVRIDGKWRTIVGVHRDYYYRTPIPPPQGPAVFLPMTQDYSTHAIAVVRTKTDPSLVAVPLRQAIQGFDANLPVTAIMTMEENVGYQFIDTKIMTGTLILFGAISAILAAMGLYGVLATFVNQRRREFGVRAAMGATPGDLRGMVLVQSTRLTLIGVAGGLLLSMACAKLLQSAIEDLSTSNPMIYAAGALGVAIMATITTLMPSRTAARLDPIVALRYE